VKLVEAAPVAGALRFELLSQGRYTGKAKGSGKGAKKAQAGGAKPGKSGQMPAKSGRESRRPTVRVKAKRQSRAR